MIWTITHALHPSCWMRSKYQKSAHIRAPASETEILAETSALVNDFKKASRSLSFAGEISAELLYLPVLMSEIRPEFTDLSGRLKKNWISLFFILRPTIALIRAISSSEMLRFWTIT